MKILYFTDAQYPGGATNQLLTLLKYLDKKEFTPLVAFGDFPELTPWIEQLKSLGIPTLKVGLKKFNSLKALSEFKRIFKSAEADLIHLHLCHSGSLRAAFLANNLPHTKLITTEHDPFPLSPLKRQVKYLTLSLTDHTIAISESNRNFLTETYGVKGSKITRIYNGVDLQVFSPGEAHKNSVLGFGEDDFVITSIAEFHPRKGLYYLIRAFAKVSKEVPHAKLALVGTGQKFADYQKLVKKLEIEHQVKFLGYRTDIPEILRASQVFVLPSTREAFGLAVLEAMACQTPVVCSRVGGLKEIVTAETGLSVPPKDVAALTKSLVRLAESQDLRAELTKNAYTRVQANFSAELMAKHTTELYQKVLRSA